MSDTDSPISPPGNPCLSCEHYFVTWKKNYPHGCRSFNMESKYYPSLAVIKESRLKCLYYQKRNPSPHKSKTQSQNTNKPNHTNLKIKNNEWEIII